MPDSIKLNQHTTAPQFWRLQLVFWGGVAVLSLLSVVPRFAEIGLLPLLHALSHGILGAILSYPLHLVFSIVWKASIGFRVFLSLFSVAIAAGIWNVFRTAIFVLATEQQDLWQFFWDWYFAGIYVFLCWATLYHGIRYYQLFQSETIMKLEAEAVVSKEKFVRLHAESETREAQLKMLRYQLNPHFLFNTLNAINSLIGTGDPKKAQTMIVQLSQFLRYSLDNNPETKISMEREIKALNRYLKIEKTRFAERLQINIEVESEVRQALIPSLLLQPLIENSMKHAIAKSEDGGFISVKASLDGNRTLVELSDSGAGVSIAGNKISNSEGRGIGLRNTIDRLKAFYGAHFSFDLDSSSNGGLKIKIRIPFET